MAKLKHVSPEDKLHETLVRKITEAVKKGSLTFDEAAKLAETENEELKLVVIDDALKVLLAEMHFQDKISIESLAVTLGVPSERLETAKSEMLSDVQEAAAELYRKQTTKFKTFK